MSQVVVTGSGNLACSIRLTLEAAGIEVVDEGGLVILADDSSDEMRAALVERADKDVQALCLTQLTVQQGAEYSEIARAARIDSLCGVVIGLYSDLGTPSSIVCYSGSKSVFSAFSNVVDALCGARWLSENPAFAALMSFTANGVHYSTVLGLYMGIGMCKKYGFPLETFYRVTQDTMPLLSEGAYRNVWAGLNGPRTFEDVDDVIHGMEMLVCLMKRTGGDAEIRDNRERQMLLNEALSAHWSGVMTGCAGEVGDACHA